MDNIYLGSRDVSDLIQSYSLWAGKVPHETIIRR